MTILQENTIYSSNLGVQQIPEEVFAHSKVVHLDLSYNKLKHLDPRLGGLGDLRYLDLSNNNLEELPDFIHQLKALEVLMLSNNPWKNFPEVICQLPKLKLLKLKGNTITFIPSTIANLKTLEHLDLAFNPLQDLPPEMAALTALKVLVCTSNEFETFPEVLLEMEQLDALKELDLDFRLRLSTEGLERFFKVLKHLKKQKASLEIKRVAYHIFFDKEFEGSPENVLPLLLVNYVEFSKKVREYIVQNYAAAIQPTSQIAILGKTTWLSKEDWNGQHEITNSITPTTTHVLLGSHISKQQIKTLHHNLAFISEKTLLAQLYPKQPAGWMLEHQNQILELLRSEQNENIALALQMTKDNELLDDLMTELLLAYTYVEPGNTELRNEFKEIFYRNIPNFDQITLPNASFRFYTPHKTENAIFQGIKNITEQTPIWNGLKLAHYLFDEYRVAFSYIMAKSTAAEEQLWLQQFLEGDTLNLSSIPKIKKLPLSLPLLQEVRILNLKGCNFRKFPNVELLAQMTNLEEIDLRENPLSHIPKALYRFVSRYRILLSK